VKDRVKILHAKDTSIEAERLQTVGYNGAGWWRYRLPGSVMLGWTRFLRQTRCLGFDGTVAIEHEDSDFGWPRKISKRASSARRNLSSSCAQRSRRSERNYRAAFRAEAQSNASPTSLDLTKALRRASGAIGIVRYLRGAYLAQRGNLVRRKGQRGGAQIVGELLRIARAEDYRSNCRLGCNPGKRHLRHADAAGLGDRTDRVNDSPRTLL
jgi:hypothetical protein